MPRVRGVARELERGWADRLLVWREGPLWQQAEVSCARYFVAATPFEALAWAEPRDLGGRYRVDIGTFGSVAEARAECERDARLRLRRAEDDGPIDIHIAPPRRGGSATG